MVRILHTADWHLGARLVEQERAEEHARFLAWLLQQIEEHQPDLLVVAGDVFDSANPPQDALAQYYKFLAGVVARSRTQVLVLGGNHDSALTLDAPADLLRSLRIRVVGAVPKDPADGLLDLPEAVVCAVPYLRERDVRRAAPGQSFEQVAREIRDGVVNHYRQAFERAHSAAGGRAIIATGHLTALGCQASASERLIHIGNLGAVPADCFDGFAYVALGHLHRPQTAGAGKVCYSGSPLALGFDEADIPKQILLVDISAPDQVAVRPIPVPCFRRLFRLTCCLSALPKTLSAAVSPDLELRPWVEVTIEDGAEHPDLDRQVRAVARAYPLNLLKLAVPRPASAHDTEDAFAQRPLADRRPEEVFVERLQRGGIDPDSETGRELRGTFGELLSKMQDAQNVGATHPAE